MDTSARIELLARIELFSQLDPGALTQIAAQCQEENLAQGGTLMRQGDQGDAMFVVVEGLLHVFTDRAPDKHIAVIRPPSLVGEMPLLLGGTRTATIRAAEATKLLRISRAAIDTLAQHVPHALASLVETVRQRLRRNQLAKVVEQLFGGVDADTVSHLEPLAEWVRLKRGNVLFQQGDAGDSWYVVMNGRLSVVVRTAAGHDIVVNKMGAGESLGEMSIFLDSDRTATVYAMRDTELIRFPKDAFNKIIQTYPSVSAAIIRLLANRIVRKESSTAASRAQRVVLGLIPATAGDWTAKFGEQFAAALAALGPTAHLTRQKFEAEFGLSSMSNLHEDHPSWSRFSSWVEDAEARYQYVILEAEGDASTWSKRVVDHADRCVYLAQAQAVPAMEIYQQLQIKEVFCAPPWQLALVHPATTKLPQGTAAWLQSGTFERHTHVRADRPADVGRLARVVVGRAVGIALGGGGARGFAHIGVLRALEEAGVPIDMICGTSMGSIMAGQYGMGVDFDTIIAMNRKMIEIKPFVEYTLPIMALLKSKKIDQVAQLTFGDVRIEDMWINYFCISSNLTTSQAMVHEQGELWVATRASGSLPGVAVPVLVNGQLLVDGGVINNVPGDVMRSRCGGRVLAVNVSPEEDVAVDFSELPSPWKVFWSRVLPWRKPVKIPTILDILMRTTMLGSASRLRMVREQVDLLLEPPIHSFGMLEFESIDALIEVGYVHAKEALETWRKKNGSFV